MKCLCKNIDEVEVLELVKEGFSLKDILEMLDKTCEIQQKCKKDLVQVYKIIVRER